MAGLEKLLLKCWNFSNYSVYWVLCEVGKKTLSKNVWTKHLSQGYYQPKVYSIVYHELNCFFKCLWEPKVQIFQTKN